MMRILLRCPGEGRTQPHFRGTHRLLDPPGLVLQVPTTQGSSLPSWCWHPLRGAVPHLLHMEVRRELGLKAGLGGMSPTW